ncbi:tight adherence protein B [Paenarthrobacter nitroguajacolicus]|uniref:type II secretion system F family protein n=1 Tax=Paenarthrobacter TaxID=1742992 RepID=UPI0028612FBE|nr:type II secretion system F family protein [Paenarthrobacter nitroguajacolicus]MDR6987711.1 tight adherence protein B [Paenarthrobacter nitroguajacolicus]
MESPIFFVTAIGLCLAALVIVVVFVLKPRNGRLPVDRRRLGAPIGDSAVGRVSQSAVHMVDTAIGRSGGPFNREILYNAGVKQAPADFTVMVAIVTVAVGVLGSLLLSMVIGILMALITPCVAKLVLVVKTEKRRAKFDAQLTDTIQMLIGGLKVGHSIMRSFEAAAQEVQAPTAEELSRIVNEVRIGRDPRQAIEECAGRMDSEDFRWIGQAIQINREVGGDLAEVLEQVAGTIRERGEIKAHVKALSAEGKMSAYILMALPIGVGLLLTLMNPKYMSVFVTHPVGIALLIASAILFAVGGFWMSRTVKITF